MHSKENNPGRNELKRIIGLVLDSPVVVLGSESLRSWFLLYIRNTLFTQRNNLKDLLSMVAFQILFAFKKNPPRGRENLILNCGHTLFKRAFTHCSYLQYNL